MNMPILKYPPRFLRNPATLTLVTAQLLACSSSSERGETPGAGASAGMPASGGDAGTGANSGMESSGGSLASGGSIGAGGNAGSGGAASATGGAGGIDGSGGIGGSGGQVATGTPYVFVGSTSGDVYAFTMNESTGALTAAGSQDVDALDFMTLGPDKNTLFVSANGSLSAYIYNKSSGIFSFVDKANTSGEGTHVNVDSTGQFVFVAHYGADTLSFFDYSASEGFSQEETFSPGKKAHQVRIDAAGTGVYVPCLGSNYVAHYLLNVAAGSLAPAAKPTSAASGGPRHMIFHPSGSVAYVLAELSSRIHVFNVSAATGALEARPGDTVLTNAAGNNSSSDIEITSDGKFVYAVNRNPNEIVAFAVNADQGLTRLGTQPLTGVVRSFAMDPRRKFLQVGGSDGRLVAYSINQETGALTAGSSVSQLGSINNTEIHYLPD